MKLRVFDVGIGWSVPAGIDDPVAQLFGEHVRPSPRPRLELEFVVGTPSAPLEDAHFFFDEVRGVQHPDGTATITNGCADVRITAGGTHASFVLGRATMPSSFSRTLTVALVLALARQFVFHVHAAALSLPRGRVLLAGGSGVGKSSTAIGLALAGAHYLSDDATFVSLDRDRVSLDALPFPFHVTTRTLSAFPSLFPHVGERIGDDKYVLRDARAFPAGRMDAGDAPRAILFPGVAGPVTCVRSISRADALGRLIAASAWCALPNAANARQHMDALARLVDGAETYELDVAPDVLGHPARLRSIIENVL